VRRCDCEAKLGQDGFAPLPVVGIFVDEEDQGGETLLVARPAPAPGPVPAIRALTFVGNP
jgi:hypothetical protein